MLVLPERLPDETLFSLCARIHRLNGFSQENETSLLLFRNARLLTHHDLPFGLNAFASQTNEVYGTGSVVLQSMTVLPYFTRLFSPERRALIEGLACGGEGNRLKFFLGVVASRAGACLPLAYCPRCARHDLELTGFSYWRRTHQLPGVFICEQHGDPLLRASRLEGFKRLRSSSLPADNRIPMAPACSPGETARNRLQSLAVISRSFLESSQISAFDPQVLRHTYRQALKDHGLLTKAGNLRIALYLSSVRSHFSSICRVESLQPFFKDTWIRGFLKPLRSNGATVGSSLLHSLMIDLLWGDWAAFCKTYAWQQSLTTEPFRKRLQPELSSDDVAKRGALRQRIDSLLDRPEGRPSRRQVAEELGWDFKWMQIFDGVWLRSRLPAEKGPGPKRRGGNYQVDWIERDRELSARLNVKGPSVGRFTGRQQITRQTIVDRLGGTRYVIRWNRLPLAKKAADELVRRIKQSSGSL